MNIVNCSEWILIHLCIIYKNTDNITFECTYWVGKCGLYQNCFFVFQNILKKVEENSDREKTAILAHQELERVSVFWFQGVVMSLVIMFHCLWTFTCRAHLALLSALPWLLCHTSRSCRNTLNMTLTAVINCFSLNILKRIMLGSCDVGIKLLFKFSNSNYLFYGNNHNAKMYPCLALLWLLTGNTSALN